MKSYAATGLRRGFAAGLVGLAALALAACAPSGGSPGPAPSTGETSAGLPDGVCEPTTVRLVLGTVGTEPVWVGQEQGIFKKHGLDVELVPGGNSAEIGGVRIIQAAAQGLGLKAFLGSLTGPPEPVTSGIVALPDSGIHGWADLKGKTIGLQGTHDTTHLATLLGLATVGLKESDVTIVQLPLANLTDAVLSKQIDVAYLIGATFDPAIAKGLVLVANPAKDVIPYVPAVNYSAKDSWLKANEATARCFQAALIEANTLALADDAKLIRQARVDHNKTDPAIAAAATISGYETDISVNGFKILVDGMTEFDFIDKPVTLDDVLSPITPTRD